MNNLETARAEVAEALEGRPMEGKEGCDDCRRALAEWEERAYRSLPTWQYFSWVCLRCAKARAYDDLIAAPPNFGHPEERVNTRNCRIAHVRYLEMAAAKREGPIAGPESAKDPGSETLKARIPARTWRWGKEDG